MSLLKRLGVWSGAFFFATFCVLFLVCEQSAQAQLTKSEENELAILIKRKEEYQRYLELKAKANEKSAQVPNPEPTAYKVGSAPWEKGSTAGVKEHGPWELFQIGDEIKLCFEKGNSKPLERKCETGNRAACNYIVKYYVTKNSNPKKAQYFSALACQQGEIQACDALRTIFKLNETNEEKERSRYVELTRSALNASQSSNRKGQSSTKREQFYNECVATGSCTNLHGSCYGGDKKSCWAALQYAQQFKKDLDEATRFLEVLCRLGEEQTCPLVADYHASKAQEAKEDAAYAKKKAELEQKLQYYEQTQPAINNVDLAPLKALSDSWNQQDRRPTGAAGRRPSINCKTKAVSPRGHRTGVSFETVCDED